MPDRCLRWIGGGVVLVETGPTRFLRTFLAMNKECLISRFCFSLYFRFVVVTLKKIVGDWLLKNGFCFSFNDSNRSDIL